MARETKDPHLIFAVDPGKTTGIAIMHVDPQHKPVVKRLWTAQLDADDFPYDRPNPAAVDPPRENPYLIYYGVCRQIMQLWTAARRSAEHFYKIHPPYHYFCLEDWVFAANPRDTKREAFASVFIAHHILGWDHGLTVEYEQGGRGPARASDFVFIAPGERAKFQDMHGREVTEAKLEVLPKTRNRHVNDAIVIGVVSARQAGIFGILEPTEDQRSNEVFRLHANDPMYGDVTATGEVTPFHWSGVSPDSGTSPKREPPTRLNRLGLVGQGERKKQLLDEKNQQARKKKWDKGMEGILELPGFISMVMNAKLDPKAETSLPRLRDKTIRTSMRIDDVTLKRIQLYLYQTDYIRFGGGWWYVLPRLKEICALHMKG